MKRITKKEQYINSIRHDIAWTEDVLQKMNMSQSSNKWAPYYGVLKPLRFWAEENAYLKHELAQIEADSSYKPWKEYQF
jgi:hypothetical protein